MLPEGDHSRSTQLPQRTVGAAALFGGSMTNAGEIPMGGILSDLRVLELSGSPAGSFCGKMLADHGAETIKVEPPGWGDQARHEPPFIGGEPDPDRSTLFLNFNTNKRSITLDLEQSAGRELLQRLVERADIVIESYPPSEVERLGLASHSILALNPRAVLVSLTYFGMDGPWSHYRGDDLIAQAIGGYLYAVTGSATQPPMGTTQLQMDITSARNGLIGTMTALMRRAITGEGCVVDVSAMEAAVSTPSSLIHAYAFTGRSPHRGGGDNNVLDGMHLPTKDGEVTLTTAGTGGRPMEVWAELLEEPRLLDERFQDRAGRAENWKKLYDLVAPKLLEWENLDLMRETMELGLVIGLVQTPRQIVESPHLDERGFFVEIEHPGVGSMRYPGPGYLINGRNPMQVTRPAPKLGEHNAEVLGGELGLSIDALGVLRAAHVI